MMGKSRVTTISTTATSNQCLSSKADKAFLILAALNLKEITKCFPDDKLGRRMLAERLRDALQRYIFCHCYAVVDDSATASQDYLGDYHQQPPTATTNDNSKRSSSKNETQRNISSSSLVNQETALTSRRTRSNTSTLPTACTKTTHPLVKKTSLTGRSKGSDPVKITTTKAKKGKPTATTDDNSRSSNSNKNESQRNTSNSSKASIKKNRSSVNQEAALTSRRTTSYSPELPTSSTNLTHPSVKATSLTGRSKGSDSYKLAVSCTAVVKRQATNSSKSSISATTTTATMNGKRCVFRGAKRKRCSIDECNNQAITDGVCCRHGAKMPICKYATCVKLRRQGGVCTEHGAKRKKCSNEECSNRAIVGGVCTRHGTKTKKEEC